MDDPSLWHRLQFAFTIVYHYLFPQLTMGLALHLVLWKWRALRRGDAPSSEAARFWARIFGVNFAFGVVTGVPMEFQFGTNWARFSAYSGGVIGQTLALEGMFAFFLESMLVAGLVWGEKRLGPRVHFWVTVGVFVGSWLSGYFIVTTNAFMQHPVGHAVDAQGRLVLAEMASYLLNPWALVEYAHTMVAAVVTASFVVAAVGAYYLLRGAHRVAAERFVKSGVQVGLVAALLVAFPTGDRQAKLVAEHQPVTLAAMEGRFESGPNAPLTFIGQPNVRERRIDNAIHAPAVLSILAYGTPQRSVLGLEAFPENQWPTNIELLYYSFHVMAGLGTLFIALLGLANLALFRRRLFEHRALLWCLMLGFPFPYIATTAGWMTAELGRQPWLVFGLFRTIDGTSDSVSSGNALFTLIGFTGLYFVLGILFVFLIGREVAHGPGAPPPEGYGDHALGPGDAHG
ncbi:MAG TPA: cytochrome ubiquinol oxidase subunit I [Polyangiaceae bacterium]|nr:cytochrome ubiquinol oxidase subunit I [Polyangiaceae bacterium]